MNHNPFHCNFSATKPVRSLCAALLFATFAAAATAQEVAFKLQLPKVGDERGSKWNMHAKTELSVSINGAPVAAPTVEKSEIKVRQETVLSVKDDAVTKMKVAFGEMKTSEVQAEGVEKNSESPLSGRTFILEAGADGLSATDESGKAVDEETLKELKDNYKRFGKPDRFFKLFDGKTVRVGDKIDVAREIVVETMTDGKSQLEAFTFTLKELRQEQGVECAVVDVALKLKGQPQPAMTFAAELKGELIVEVKTCWPLSMRLEGPMTITGAQEQDGQQIDFDGKGTMRIRVTAKYGK